MSPPQELTFSNQYAFRRTTGSTTAAFISLFHTITIMLDFNQFIRVIALNFSKAYETVRHAQLIAEFNKLKIPANMINWIADFLTERYHCTLFEGQFSSSKQINSSVVQGSVLSPSQSHHQTF